MILKTILHPELGNVAVYEPTLESNREHIIYMIEALIHNLNKDIIEFETFGKKSNRLIHKLKATEYEIFDMKLPKDWDGIRIIGYDEHLKTYLDFLFFTNVKEVHVIYPYESKKRDKKLAEEYLMQKLDFIELCSIRSETADEFCNTFLQYPMQELTKKNEPTKNAIAKTKQVLS